ncbi:acyltransferase [Curtobacterium flaccumfaciens pv. flaccumfaciens]|uniref:acyltransferase family protein n=1 Tax=Curtobacterium flaccumfaciens TaxID=2035 RepID=UPI0021B0B1B5|nr:acyltransferase [Curtobacterium flaccumfaciens]QYI97632.1 acyltransferase [Curtobacterium flaccumfaciens pv. flaccumfaciens]UXN22583.1 acyltransferase [Curtobacterium flaccumfaciens pv. flaccumfaciens]
MSSARAPRLDLAHIDGMRGILAAFVVVAHTVQFTGVAGSVATSMPFVYRVLSAGDLRVPAFIAISGFTMMIAVSGRHDLRLGTSYGAYAKRRIRRLVPPYLAALVLALALIAFVPVMNEPHGTVWDDKLPVTLQGIVTHVFLLHNLSPEWITSINGTLWSLPIEMQLTLLMPVLLLLWRRTHPVVVIVVSFALAVLSIATGVGAWSAPHFLGVFGVGMYGAFLVIGSEDDLRRRRPRAVQRMLRHQRSVLVVALVVLTAAFAQVAAAPGIVHGAVTGTVAGLGITLLLMVLAEGQRTGRVGTHGVRRFLGGRRLVQSGLVSYSVFLVHSPLLALGNLLLLPLGLPTPAQFGLMLFVVAPVVVAVCVVFAVLVERPFMNSHQRALLGELFGRRAVPDAPLIAPADAPAEPAVPVSGGRRRAAAGAAGPRPRRR